MEHESGDNTNCNWCFCYSHQRISARTGELENKWMKGDYANYCNIEISQNIEKGFEDLRRLDFSQTPVSNRQLMLM